MFTVVPHLNDNQLQTVLDAMPALMWLAAPDGGIVYSNRRWLEYTGLSAQQTSGSGWTSAVHPDDIGRLLSYQQTILALPAPTEVETRLRRFDGQWRWVLICAAPLRDGSGNLTGWCGTVIDIDDRHRAEDAARAAEHDLRLILDNVPALVKTMTPTGEINFANRRLLDYLGVSLEQLHDWPSRIHESDRPMLMERLTHALASGQPFQAECRLRRADGVYRWVLGSAVPVHAQDGAIVRWYFLITDVEDRKQSEELLRSSERQLRAIFDNIPALLSVMTDSGELELVNQASLNYHGCSLDEIKRWKTNDIVHPDDLAAEVAVLTRAFETGQPLVYEQRLRRADGEYRWFQLRALRSRNDWNGGARWYCVETDIHERKLAEEALLRSETRLLEVQQLSRTGAWRYDRASDTVESSPEIQRAYAPQAHEDISRPAFWFDRIHPEDRPRVQTHYEHCVAEKTAYRAGYRIVLPDGSLRYQYATGRPVTNDAGELVQFIGASMDMTEHWLATTELERTSQTMRDLQTKMSRASEIATVGELAGSIAHEVNQPLAAVVANGHACLRWLAASPPNVAKAVEAAERIVKDGKDAGEVVKRVRALFKRAAVEKVPLDVNEVIREVLGLLDRYPASRQVSVETALDADLPHLCADRIQLQQLVLNLLVNALEAMEPIQSRPKRLTIRSNRAEEKTVMIHIADNGLGLDNPETVFEPFVTTKAAGMGLGLTICRSIVTAHGGRLSAATNVGFGTTFTVALPIHTDPQP